MEPYPDIQIPESNVNLIVDILLERYRTCVDTAGNPVFKSVERGLAIPGQTINESYGLPAIRIWEDRTIAQVKSIQQHDQLWFPTISVFVCFHSLPDASGNYPDAQRFRNKLTKFALKVIQYPEAGDPNGITPGNYWNFNNPQQIPIDFTAPLRRIGLDVPIEPPWFITRMDIGLECFNIP
jgi:hypothetical protein